MNPAKATISDADPKLINFYRCVQKCPSRLCKDIDDIIYLKNSHSMEWFYDFVGSYKPNCDFKKAALFHYSASYSFNSIGKSVKKHYRYFKENDKHKLIFDYKDYFSNVQINLCSYSTITPKCGDFVYFDPPYYNTYNAYDVGSNWNANHQEELYRFCKVLDRQGVKFMVSNSYEHFILDLYSEWNVISVTKMQSAGGGKKIKMAKEALIRNYD